MTGPLMHIIETAPPSYERFIGPVTLYKIRDVRNRIVDYLLYRKAKVLDTGCGAGGLASDLLKKNDSIELYCMDISEEMLNQTKKNLSFLSKEKKSVHLIHGDVLNIANEFNDYSLDAIINIHLLSEMEPAFIDQLIKEYFIKLKPKSFLFIADELVPRSNVVKIIFYTLRFPFDFLSYLIDRHSELKNISFFLKIKYYLLELPLIIATYFSNFPLTKPLKNLDEKLTASGFDIIEKRLYQFETFGLYVARKK